jgi:hypothetical protein
MFQLVSLDYFEDKISHISNTQTENISFSILDEFLNFFSKSVFRQLI